MDSLKDRTISGVFWSFLQNVGARGVALLTAIILARLLTPADFGLIGMLSIFIALSQTLIDGGLNLALIQKKDTDDEDYSTVFYINLTVSIIIYLILFLLAPLIAKFYNQPILCSLTRVLSINVLVNAFVFVQDSKLKKALKFKTLMIIHIPSMLISGVIAIIMALLGAGVWSIVGQQLSMRMAYAIQLWFYSKWTPSLVFNKAKAKALFSFGSKVMLSNTITTLYDNVYLIVIGKFFPIDTLGYYSNGKKLVDMPTQTLSTVLKSVTFSAFSAIQDEDHRLKEGYKKMIKQILFWLTPFLTLAAVTAVPLFKILLTAKWLPSVPFFRLLCIVGVIYPLNSFNINIINVKGRSDIVLKLDILKKTIITVGVFLAIPFGIWAVVIFQPINAILAYIINSHYSGRFINYSLREQVGDIYHIFVACFFVGSVIYFIDLRIQEFTPDIIRLLIGWILGFVGYLMLAWRFKFDPFLEFITIVKARLLKSRYLRKANS